MFANLGIVPGAATGSSSERSDEKACGTSSAEHAEIDLTLSSDDDNEGGHQIKGLEPPLKRQCVRGQGISAWLGVSAPSAVNGAAPPPFVRSAEAPSAVRELLGPSLLPLPNSEQVAFYAPLFGGDRSWIVLVRGFLRSGLESFDALWSRHPMELGRGHIFGKAVTFHRYQQAFGGDYAFSGQLAKAAPLTQAEAPEIFEVQRRLRACLQQSSSWLRDCHYDSCLANWYDGGKHWIGAHSDDERELVPEAPIFALSWGEARDFKVSPKKDCGSQRLQLELRDGDLIVMGGACQRTHKHEVPARSRSVGRRISLTFRCFKAQNPHLSAPS